ncbi:DUF2934 domain-containing protein (plasmid) [Rhizobium sp. RCAM05350]|nr:DUF2934 domain-containing protein [Rhizobium sp. RCAM05350]
MTDISEDDIRMRAHALWEADGRPDGSHDVHWQQALRELTEEAGAVAGAVPPAPAKTSKLSVVKNEAAIEPVVLQAQQDCLIFGTPYEVPANRHFIRFHVSGCALWRVST